MSILNLSRILKLASLKSSNGEHNTINSHTCHRAVKRANSNGSKTTSFGLFILKKARVSHQLIVINLIGQLKPRLEKTFWEKLGFKDKKKEDQNLRDAKEKTDKMYR